jgi:hypothetical protein
MESIISKMARDPELKNALQAGHPPIPEIEVMLQKPAVAGFEVHTQKVCSCQTFCHLLISLTVKIVENRSMGSSA